MSLYDVMHCTYLVASCCVLINFVHCDKYIEYPLEFWFVEHFYLILYTLAMCFIVSYLCRSHDMLDKLCHISSLWYITYRDVVQYVYDLFSYYICMLLAVIII